MSSDAASSDLEYDEDDESTVEYESGSEDGRNAFLELLPTHPIFSQSDLASDALPASPNLSAIDLASDLASDVSVENAPRLLSSSRKQSLMCILRDTELVVAVGSEIRICNLAAVKAKVDAQEDPSTSRLNDLTYKILDIPDVNFPVVSLVPSPTNQKLLAIIGESQAVVVVVPRKDWSALISTTVKCKTAVIGAFYHSKSAFRIVGAQWHPLSHKGASLCVLTSDCLMREYDLNGDTDDPVFTLDFSQESLSKKSKGKNAARSSNKTFSINGSTSFNSSIHRSTFMEDDPEDDEAVAMCFGSQHTPWGAMTIYCLLADGTLYSACPYLPQTSSCSQEYLEYALAYTELVRKDSLKNRNPDVQQSLLSDQTTPTKSYDHLRIDTRLAAQTKYLKYLLEQESDPLSKIADSPDEFKIQLSLLPTTLPKLRRQGPFLFQPSPPALSGQTESLATDLTYTYLPSKSGQGGTGLLLIAFSDGKIDLCLETCPIEARWEAQNEADLPILRVQQSLDLGLAAKFEESSDCSALDKNALSLVGDPINPNLIYIYHAFGVHSVLLAPWSDVLTSSSSDSGLVDQLNNVPSSTLTLELWTASIEQPNHTLPISALVISKDVYLGYNLLMMTNNFTLKARECSLSAADVDPVSASVAALDISEPSADGPAYLPLLPRPVFEIPSPLDRPMRQSRLSSPAEAVSNPQARLRFLAETVTKLRDHIRDLLQAGQTIQARFETQGKELSRQLAKAAEARQTLDNISLDVAENRIAHSMQQQKLLIRRLDKALHRLSRAQIPDISLQEQEWFVELDRLQTELESTANGKTLRARIEQIHSKLQMVRKQADEQTTGKGGEKSTPMQLGKSQIQRIEAMLEFESEAIAKAKNKILALQEVISTAEQ